MKSAGSPAIRSEAKPGRVLVVDDHRAVRESVIDVLQQAGYWVDGAASPLEALPRLEQSAIDVVITDLQMPGMDGLEFIRNIARRRLPVQIIMVTAHGTIASAVEAMRLGAFDYLEKPFDATQLEKLTAQALQRRRLCDRDGEPATAAGVSAADDLGMVGQSPAVEELRRRIRQVAPTDETVLICGESGTGKELVARAVHSLSRRAGGPLVTLNCPALSPQLAESELFGHRRGAFTGADADRTGRFEMAANGAILLDEITEIDLPLQAKLLRVLQERTFEPVGSSETRTVDVRVMASTNRDLFAEIAAGRFREDLYYRLAVVPLMLPPLRERTGDVELLAEHFLQRAGERLGRPRLELSEEARQLLVEYAWPGNVRELENLITRACVLNQGREIAADELRLWLKSGEDRSTATIEGAPGRCGPRRLEDVERSTILATLQKYNGNRAQTAEALGIGVRTLSSKLRAWGYAPRTREFGDVGGDRQKLPAPSAEIAAIKLRRIA